MRRLVPQRSILDSNVFELISIRGVFAEKWFLTSFVLHREENCLYGASRLVFQLYHLAWLLKYAIINSVLESARGFICSADPVLFPRPTANKKSLIGVEQKRNRFRQPQTPAPLTESYPNLFWLYPNG